MMMDKQGTRVLIILTAASVISLLAACVVAVLTASPREPPEPSDLAETLEVLEDRLAEAEATSAYWQGFKAGMEYQKEKDFRDVLDYMDKRKVPKPDDLKGSRTFEMPPPPKRKQKGRTRRRGG